MQVPNSWLKNMAQLALILRGKYFLRCPAGYMLHPAENIANSFPRIPTKEKSPVQQIL